MGYRLQRVQDFARGVRESRALAERERWSRERLERFQDERLAELARYAAEHSAFWRERLPRGRLELSELPVLTKVDLMERFDELVTDARLRRDELLAHLAEVNEDTLYLDEYRVMTSSGSSGRKAVFVYDRAAWRAILTMFLRRGAWVGLRPRLPRTRLALIGGGAPTHMSRRGAQSMNVGMHRLLGLSVTQPLDELVAALNRFQPDFINVYPSTAGLLADEQIAGRLTVSPKGITTNSEPLTPALRERLERAFLVQPTDFYATTEGVWGHECEHGSMHLFDDMCIVENVDDDLEPVAHGEVGSRLLVTNLFNRTQPLIRFEVTDLVAYDTEPCPCGRSLMRVSSLDGRAEDVLTVGGVTVHPLQFGIVTADPDVREFQVVQKGDALRLRVALRDGSAGAEERLGASLRERLAELGVSRPDVSVERVEALERSAGGKLQVVVAAR
jgi:phenylacetate-coenzyme A ligase PaaK-like adenylate-forming protein